MADTRDPDAPRPLPGFQLAGADGNAFAIMGRFMRAARRAGLRASVIADVVNEAKDGDYDHLLRTFMPWEGEEEERP